MLYEICQYPHYGSGIWWRKRSNRWTIPTSKNKAESKPPYSFTHVISSALANRWRTFASKPSGTRKSKPTSLSHHRLPSSKKPRTYIPAASAPMPLPCGRTSSIARELLSCATSRRAQSAPPNVKSFFRAHEIAILRRARDRLIASIVAGVRCW